MAEFTLPKMSRVHTGKHHPAQAGAKKVRTFRVYRWDPDVGGNPRVDTYKVDMDEDDLENAPSYRRGNEPDYDDEGYGRFVYGYYGVPY